MDTTMHIAEIRFIVPEDGYEYSWVLGAFSNRPLAKKAIEHVVKRDIDWRDKEKDANDVLGEEFEAPHLEWLTGWRDDAYYSLIAIHERNLDDIGPNAPTFLGCFARAIVIDYRLNYLEEGAEG